MPYTTRAMLQEQVETLERRLYHVQGDRERMLLENEALRKLIDLYQRHLSTMTLGAERLADSLSHTNLHVMKKESSR